ncbi:MAG: NAD-dependent epimerase/dehydratase family protein, partial [Pseudomonadota bacterium]
MTSRALVTGLGGFTGQYMARELSAMGYQVVGLGQRGVEQAEHIEVDLRERVTASTTPT